MFYLSRLRSVEYSLGAFSRSQWFIFSSVIVGTLCTLLNPTLSPALKDDNTGVFWLIYKCYKQLQKA